MITIQTVMLVALGFLLATLLALMIAPAYRARAIRFTLRQIQRTMPLNAGEMRAETDRLRAEHAVRVHELEKRLEKAKLAAARQQVDVNRRDASIGSLEAELVRVKSDLEQNANARRVLEQTIMDRLPAVEQRLADTRELLDQRDRELAAVTSETGKTTRALDEVMQINAQQRAEIERLNAVVATRAARNRGSLKDPRFDAEVALRSELEALRARARDQDALIDRLQALVSDSAGSAPAPRENGSAEPAGEVVELDRLRRDLADARAALRSVSAQTDGEASRSRDGRISELEATIAEQVTTIRRLEASLAAYEQGAAGTRSISLKDSKIAMKARIGSLQAEVDAHSDTIQRLRAEIASANERLAIQAAQFMDEMRRMGTGSPGSAPQARRPAGAAARRSLAERIGEIKPSPAGSIAMLAQRGEGPAAREEARENTIQHREATAEGSPPAAPGPALEHLAQDREPGGSPNGTDAVDAASTSALAAEAEGKPRLLDRIASLSKS